MKVRAMLKWGLYLKAGRTSVSLTSFPFWRFQVTTVAPSEFAVTLPGILVMVKQEPHPSGGLLMNSLSIPECNWLWRKDQCWREKEGEPQYQAPGVDP